MVAARPEWAFAEAEREATYRDVLDAPTHLVAELVAGELVLSPRPAPPHVEAGSRALVGIGGPFGGRSRGGPERPGGWIVWYEPELHLGRHVLVPDLAGWRRERMPVVPRAPHIALPPDWVCEIVSPSSARHDRVRKLPLYAEFQVKHAWLIDPDARTLEVLRLENGRWSFLQAFGGAAKVRAEPFDAVELDIAEWWLDEPAEPAGEAPSATDPEPAAASPELPVKNERP